MTDNQKWPEWQNVAAGLPVPGAHVCAWPTASYARPMLSLHQQHKPRRLVRVEFGPNSGSVAGYQCFKGTNYLIVYEDEIPQIRARMATARDKEDLARAMEQFEAELAEHMKSLVESDGRMPTREKAIQTFWPTPWNIYARIPGARRTGFPKVLDLEVCPDPVPPPSTPTSDAEYAAQRNAEMMGRAMAYALEERERKQKTPKAAG